MSPDFFIFTKLNISTDNVVNFNFLHLCFLDLDQGWLLANIGKGFDTFFAPA